MATDKGQLTGGILAGCNKEFSCKIGDSIEQIKQQNLHLSEDELQRVFNITREQTDEKNEQAYPTED